VALFFDELTRLTPNAKAAANWVQGAVKSFLNERALTMAEFPLTTQHLADIIQLIDDNKISHSVASKQLFLYLLDNPTQTAAAAAEAQGLLQQSDSGALEVMIQQVLDANPAKVAEYRAGKKSLTGMFMGELMKLTGGKADPKLANQLLRQKLEG